jgi:hypothetical protein
MRRRQKRRSRPRGAWIIVGPGGQHGWAWRDGTYGPIQAASRAAAWQQFGSAGPDAIAAARAAGWCAMALA